MPANFNSMLKSDIITDEQRRIARAAEARPWRMPHAARMRQDVIHDLEHRKNQAMELARCIPSDIGVRPSDRADFRIQARAVAKALDYAISGMRAADAMAKANPSLDTPVRQESKYWKIIGNAYFALHGHFGLKFDSGPFPHSANPAYNMTREMVDCLSIHRRVCNVCNNQIMVLDWCSYHQDVETNTDMCDSCWENSYSDHDELDWRRDWVENERNFPECGCCEIACGRRCTVDNCHCDRPEDCQNYIQDDSSPCDCDDPDEPCDDCVMVHDPDCEQCCMCDEGFCGDHAADCDDDCWHHPKCHYCGGADWDWDTPVEDRLDNFQKLYDDDSALICEDCLGRSPDQADTPTPQRGSAQRRIAQLWINPAERNAFNIAEATTEALNAIQETFNLDRPTVAALWSIRERNIHLAPAAKLIADLRIEHAFAGGRWPGPDQAVSDQHRPYAMAAIRACAAYACDQKHWGSTMVLDMAAKLLRNRKWSDTDWNRALNNADPADAKLLAELHRVMSQCDVSIHTQIDQLPLSRVDDKLLNEVIRVCDERGVNMDKHTAYGIAELLWIAKETITT